VFVSKYKKPGTGILPGGKYLQLSANRADGFTSSKGGKHRHDALYDKIDE